MTPPSARVLLVGPHGVVGRAVHDALAAHPGWDLVSVSRRGPVADSGGGRHVRLDLLDATAAVRTLAQLDDVTHLVYAGYAHRSTMAAATAPNERMLGNVLDGLRSAGARLERVVLIGGGKSYGEHLGPYRTPAKESDPRVLGPVFYNEQEDLLVRAAARDGFEWTVLRPDVAIGVSTGSAMNLLTSLGVYAALCKDAGLPLRFPGSPGAWSALHQFTDTDLLASAVEWALRSPTAVGDVFNVTNGDHFRWQHLWADVAGAFDMPTAPPLQLRLADQMVGHEPAWRRLVDTHGLRDTSFPTRASWQFADSVLGTDHDMVQSTIKIRQAGFSSCIDTHLSVTRHLRYLREHGFLP